jgi:hypothetical protein
MLMNENVTFWKDSRGDSKDRLPYNLQILNWAHNYDELNGLYGSSLSNNSSWS